MKNIIGIPVHKQWDKKHGKKIAILFCLIQVTGRPIRTE